MFTKNTKYEILTPNGFQPFEGIKTTKHQGFITVYLEDRLELKCSPNHKLNTERGFVFANNLEMGDKVLTESGTKEVNGLTFTLEECELFDPIAVAGGSVYYSNGLESHNCAEFLGTGDTFIDSDVLGKLRDNVGDKLYTRYNNRMHIFEEPKPNHDYLIAADPSLGRGRDYSAFHVIDLYTGNQVAEFYSNKIPLNIFADHLVDEGYRYNIASIVPERNGIGQALIQQLYYVKEYENIWMDEKDFGVHVSNHNRDQILGFLEESLREGWFRIRSKRCVEELLSFIIDEKTGKVQADEGKHDDLIMSLALAAYAVKKLGNYAPLFLNNDIDSENKYSVMVPISTSDLGSDLIPGYDSGETKEDYIKWLRN